MNKIKQIKQYIKSADFKVYSIFNYIRMGKSFNNDVLALVDEISESIFRNSDDLSQQELSNILSN